MTENRENLVKVVIIARDSWIPLVTVVNDPSINAELIPAFISALHIFGKENLGRIEEILVKGLDIDLYVVSKYNLIIIAMMSPKLKKLNIRGEAEEALDAFYSMFKEQIECGKDCMDVFTSFENVLREQIKNYIYKVDSTEKGFFRRLMDMFKK